MDAGCGGAAVYIEGAGSWGAKALRVTGDASGEGAWWVTVVGDHWVGAWREEAGGVGGRWGTCGGLGDGGLEGGL